MGTFLDSLVLTFYTLVILFSALKPILKKLLSIEIVFFHTFALLEADRKNIAHRKLPQKNLKKNLLEIIKLLLWYLKFRRRLLKNFLVFTAFWP
jgi:hypothetical protein